MERTSVQKLARILRVLVIITFICNIIALIFVPALAELLAADRRDGQIFWMPLNGETFDFWLDIFAMSWRMTGPAGEGSCRPVLTAFLLFCGVCTAVILWQGKRVLDTVLKGKPFTAGNAASLKRAAVCCFLISGAALLRLIWGLAACRSILPLLTCSTLFVPIFLMAGLLCMVVSALFRQAAELKAENDLTI